MLVTHFLFPANCNVLTSFSLTFKPNADNNASFIIFHSLVHFKKRDSALSSVL
jgi:hypothetical protein